MVSRVEDRFVVEAGESLRKRPVHFLGVPTREIDPATATNEQRVSRNQAFVDQEALAARRVPGCVENLDVDLALPVVCRHHDASGYHCRRSG